MLVKEIVSAGKYLMGVTKKGPDGRLTVEKEWRDVTEADLREYADNTNQLIETGQKIPMPLYDHSFKSVPTPSEAANNPNLDYRNGAWFTKFFSSKNKAGKPALYGILEPTSEENASKIGSEVQHVSWAAVNTDDPDKQYTDGRGRKWNKVLLHVAAPLYPVNTEQENFTNLATSVMSNTYEGVFFMANSQSSWDSKVLTLLAEAGIMLPEGTDSSNFMDRLISALTQKVGNPSSSTLSEQPDDSKTEVRPIMMSLSTDQVQAIISANVVNPATSKPFSVEDFKDTPSVKEENQAKALQLMSNALKDTHVSIFKSRIDSVVPKVGKEYADQHLYPLLDTIQMSVNADSQVVVNSPINSVLSAIENLQVAPTQQASPTQQLMSVNSIPQGATVVQNPLKATSDDLSDDEVASIVKSVLSS